MNWSNEAMGCSIRVVTFHAAVMASSSMTYLMGRGVTTYDSYEVCYLYISVWCIQRPLKPSQVSA
jgi:hypothetical protein